MWGRYHCLAWGVGEGSNLRLSLTFGGSALFCAAALCIALTGPVVTTSGGSAHAGVALEERKLPMRFTWVACQPNCRGWVGAVGIVTADTPKEFDEFARTRQLGGATVVLGSSGASVNAPLTPRSRWAHPRTPTPPPPPPP